MKVERAVSYFRVSTDKQGKSGLGLEGQRAGVAEFLRGRQMNALSEFVEIESGKRSDRPELMKALAECRVHGATLVVAKLDRLSRDACFLLGLRNAGVDFVACDMPHANRLTVSLLACVAEEEGMAISQRTKVALAAAKARGTKLGTPNLTKAARAAGTIESIRRRRSAAMARAEDLRATVQDVMGGGHLSLCEMADEFNSRCIPAARGGDWKATQIKRLINQLQLNSMMNGN